ncbi:class Ib ribonucleoside-diphosphate reductase assembly flavoprotein NrdI [Paenibacillus sp. FJAT-26967]|uniref:class Ib ribonucleoside-diphosphate reductase assembly flavoprotein NrdI n=1 Tax=Paenibacillus sp. FJAT-26967 TaxID=1729690 RepID=UPI000838B96D|nr:class Ib ribonucleoside-diphosphate reductase assembly flavoprotein NrdI [Paenibacillus sp. FJAT-26967]
MLIVYDSRTGNVQRFINKLSMQAVRIEEDLSIQEPFVLVTYTTGFGQIPARVMDFLKRHSSLLRGVAASGNLNWGQSFAMSADRISSAYGVPVLAKFELSGTSGDVERFHEGVQHLETY